MSNKTRKRSGLSRRILSQYILSMIGFVFGYIVLMFIAIWFLSISGWYDVPFLRVIIDLIRNNFGAINVLIMGGALLWITYYYISKPLRYLDEVIEASHSLAQPDSNPIILSEPIETVAYEMNRIRETALLNSEKARQAEQRKNDLVVYLAHDLKTPLTSIVGYLTLLNEAYEMTEKQKRHFAAVALNKAYRLEDLINEFFEITRFNLSNIEIVRQKVDIGLMLEQVSFEFEPEFAKRGISVSIQGTTNTMISCDPDKTSRVFDNLFRNALHYSTENTIFSIQGEHTEMYTVLKFSNHGKEIPQDKLNRIFEQFYRLDTSRATATGGAGLGLAIAKEIMEAQGGKIEAASFQDRITFTLYFPNDRM